MQLSLYAITDSVDGYDVYTNWVVAARSRKQALAINPGHECNKILVIDNPSRVWSKTAKAEYIGKAAITFHQPTIICTSFNAG